MDIDPAALLSESEGRLLLAAARRELLSHYGLPAREVFEAAVVSTMSVGGVFATLELARELRGCIGFLLGGVDLLTLTRRAVVAAALDDPRFGAVTAEEVPRIRITVTVLAPPVPLRDPAEIEIGRHGLIVECSGRRGLLLPQVAATRRWDRERFLAETCRKAGLPADGWRQAGASVERFDAVHFREEEPGGAPRFPA